VSLSLIDILEASRQATGLSYRIMSGCRCPKHNEAEGGMFDSDHLTGEAADIQCMNSASRMVLLRDFVNRFDRIGIGKGFIHVGIRRDNPQNVMWLY
jgi:zinc D-Ala-D-Ala carboxypeptidase